ncbi:MAG: hypothetical protein HUU01_11285 [Saprospiraceae bacterium]|nr:hypothetical protein [Saprospiraceae bacterium]
MQRDFLEQFIKDNREAFDDATPNLKVWADVSKTLDARPPQAKRVVMWSKARVAAAIVALVTAGALFGSYLTRVNDQEAVASAELVSPELIEAEQYYNGEVQKRYSQLANYQYDKSVDQDLQQIDQIMEELRADLAEAPKGMEEEIISNLIKSYQTKIRILERVLDRTQSTHSKTSKSASDEVGI